VGGKRGAATVEAIFLDAGGVILDETEAEAERAAVLAALISREIPYTLAQYWLDVDEAVYRFVPSTYEYVLYKNLGRERCKDALKAFKAQAPSRNLVPMPGLGEALKTLSRAFKLGILGQYGKELTEILEREGLLDFFAYRDTQEGFGLTKPDPRYFLAILERAGVQPNVSVMVGDRIDKDIYPAKLIGMKTIRLRTGIHRAQEPRIRAEEPDLTVDSLSAITAEVVARL
jgi:HAD superfamily hydrolase (TIGR01549 family)